MIRCVLCEFSRIVKGKVAIYFVGADMVEAFAIFTDGF